MVKLIGAAARALLPGENCCQPHRASCPQTHQLAGFLVIMVRSIPVNDVASRETTGGFWPVTKCFLSVNNVDWYLSTVGRLRRPPSLLRHPISSDVFSAG
jgi:hypothetical protein